MAKSTLSFEAALGMLGRRVFLVRHAQAYKNVEDRHGGAGSQLTPRGLIDIHKLSAFLLQVDLRAPSIFSSARSQVSATASSLAGRLKAPWTVDQRIEPLYLGVLDGLSRTEAEERFYEPACRLEEWRRGTRRIFELDIPSAEPFQSFLQRGEEFLSEKLEEGQSSDIIVVGTRSILILLANLLLRDGRPIDESYRLLEFDNCGVSCFKANAAGSWDLLFHSETSFLERR